jgi:hypothetical protein
MALQLFDRVQVTATANTTVSFTLGSAVAGYQAFSVLTNGSTTYYGSSDGINWEVGIGTYSTTGPTLTRTTILSSSNAGSAVTFTGTPLYVWIDYPSSQAVYQNSSIVSVPYLTATGSITASSTTGAISYGTLGYSDTNIIASFASSVNGYNQIVLQNTNAGATASTNFNVSNNSGTSSTNFGEFGINSSGFTGTGAFSQPGYVYLASASTDIAIGTYGSNSIHFVVNSGATDAMTIGTTGAVTTPNTLTAANLVASNGMLVHSKTVSASYTIPTGDNAIAVGPITVASGVAVTVPSGSRWLVL